MIDEVKSIENLPDTGYVFDITKETYEYLMIKYPEFF